MKLNVLLYIGTEFPVDLIRFPENFSAVFKRYEQFLVEAEEISDLFKQNKNENLIPKIVLLGHIYNVRSEKSYCMWNINLKAAFAEEVSSFWRCLISSEKPGAFRRSDDVPNGNERGVDWLPVTGDWRALLHGLFPKQHCSRRSRRVVLQSLQSFPASQSVPPFMFPATVCGTTTADVILAFGQKCKDADGEIHLTESGKISRGKISSENQSIIPYTSEIHRESIRNAIKLCFREDRNFLPSFSRAPPNFCGP